MEPSGPKPETRTLEPYLASTLKSLQYYFNEFIIVNIIAYIYFMLL